MVKVGLYYLGNDTQAIQSFDKVLAVDPSDKYALNGKGVALNDKGNTLNSLGNYTQATQTFDEAFAIYPNDTNALDGKQNAISKIVASTPTSGYNHGCSDSQISNPADRYINQPGKGPSFHSKAFMQAYNAGFDACSHNSNIDSGVGDSINSGSQRHQSFAISDYQSGYIHGVSDGRIDPAVDCPGTQECHWYILEPGKGFRFHTWDFVRGYVIGWCSVNGPHTGFDADEATFDCDQGPHSASWFTK